MPIGSHGPLRAGTIREHVHEPLVIVSQFQRLTGIGKAPLIRADHVGDAQFQESARVGRNDQLSAALQNRSPRKQVGDASGQSPSGKVHADRHLVVQFDPLVKGLPICGMVVNFVENDGAVGPCDQRARASEDCDAELPKEHRPAVHPWSSSEQVGHQGMVAGKNRQGGVVA